MVGARVASLAAVVAVTLMGCEKECTVYKTVGTSNVSPVVPADNKPLAKQIARALETWMANHYQPKSECANAKTPQKAPPSTCYGIAASAAGMDLAVTFQLESFDPANILNGEIKGFLGLNVDLTFVMDDTPAQILMPCTNIPFSLQSDNQTILVDLVHGGLMPDQDGNIVEGCLHFLGDGLFGMVSLDVQNVTFCSESNEIAGTMVVDINELLWGALNITGNPPPTTLALPSMYCPGQLHTTTTTTILITYECTTKVEAKCCDVLGAQTWSETIDADSLADCGKWDVYYTEHGAVCNALPAIGTCENTADRALWEGNDTKQCQDHLDQSGKKKPAGPGCIKISLPPKADKECLESFFGDLGYSAPCSQTIAELIACGSKEGLDCTSECMADTTAIPCMQCLQGVMVAKCNPTFVAISGINACPEVDYASYFSQYFDWQASTSLWEHHAVDWKATVSTSAVAATTSLAVLVAFVAAISLRRRWHNWASTDDGAQAILDTEDVE